ncbi:MAG: hypothetical protein IJP17_07300 [Clostridia bacterium]|nr:hypothetical protein [Clostridia bacterium]
MKLSVKRIISLLLALALMTAMCATLSGCASRKWEGKWNRTGDATYTRAELSITDVGARGFTFSMTLYNGNIAGQLTDLYALFTNQSHTEAQYDVPDTRAYISFTLNEGGDMDVLFYDSSVGFTETESNFYSDSASTEMTIFGFEELAFITGNFQKGEVSYINDTFFATGMLTIQEDALVRNLMGDETYRRCLDCFQIWTVGDEENSGAHDDEIGGFVYYGSNTMQQYAAIIIIYDDGTASVAVSMPDGSLVYYSDNSIYGDGTVTPLPITRWIEKYNDAK